MRWNSVFWGVFALGGLSVVSWMSADFSMASIASSCTLSLLGFLKLAEDKSSGARNPLGVKVRRDILRRLEQ